MSSCLCFCPCLSLVVYLVFAFYSCVLLLDLSPWPASNSSKITGQLSTIQKNKRIGVSCVSSALLYFLASYHLFSPAFTALNAFPAIRAAAAAGSSSKLFSAATFLAATTAAEFLMQLVAPFILLVLLHILVAWPADICVFLVNSCCC